MQGLVKRETVGFLSSYGEGKKGSPVSRRSLCFIHIAAEKLTGMGEEPMAAIVLQNFSSFKMTESFI